MSARPDQTQARREPAAPAKEAPKVVRRPKQLQMGAAPRPPAATAQGPALRHAAARRSQAAPKAKSRIGGKTQALLVILLCFAASAALRAGDYISGKALDAFDEPEAAAGATRVAAANAVARGDLETGQIAAPSAGADDPTAALAAETMAALGRGPEDPAAALGLAHAEPPHAPAELFMAEASPVNRPAAESAALVEALRRRERELEEYAARLEARERELAVVEQRAEERLRELEQAREELSGLITLADEASQRDVEHLVAMYSRMKPADAAAIFDTMDPGFAAGFLVRMRADKASAILAQMDATRAYAVSLRMAGRNVRPGDAPVSQPSGAASAPAQ